MTVALNEIPRVNVLGIGISALNLDTATEALSFAARNKYKGYVCVTGVHGVSEAQGDPDFRSVLNSALLNTPDGMPMVWMGRLQGFRHIDRVYGPDLMLRLCDVSLKQGFTHFFYGGGPGVADLLKTRLQEKFPGLKVVGTYTPPFRPLSAKETAELERLLTESKPDCFWVGLSTTKQERFMAASYRTLPATVF